MWWDNVFKVSEIETLVSNVVPDNYSWVDSTDILKRLLYFSLHAEPALCVSEGCGAKLQAPNCDFSLISMAVRVLIQLAFDAIDERLTLNYNEFIFKLCKFRDSTFQPLVSTVVTPETKAPILNGPACTASCCSWWLSPQILPVSPAELLNPTNRPDYLYDSENDALVNYRGYIMNSSTACDIIALNGSFLKAPKYFQEIPKQNWNLPAKNIVKEVVPARCSCGPPALEQFIASIPLYQQSVQKENNDPMQWLEAAVAIAKNSHHSDIQVLLTASWTLAMVFFI